MKLTQFKEKHRTTFGELQKKIFSKLRLDSFVSDEHRVDYPSFQPFSHLIFHTCVNFMMRPFSPFFLFFFKLFFIAFPLSEDCAVPLPENKKTMYCNRDCIM